MSEKRKPKLETSRVLLIVAIVLPLFLWLGREAVAGQIIKFFRAADLADMLILAPIYGIFLIYLLYYMAKYEAPTALLIAFIAFSFLFMYGHAMHVTANAINTYSTEVNDYRDIIPQDSYALIFFLDERLSHFILFTAATGLIGCWLLFEQIVEAPFLFPKNLVIILLIGIVYGFVQSYAAIEAQMVWVLYPMFIILLALWFFFWRRSKLFLLEFLRCYPFSSFVVAMALFTFIITLAFGMLFAGFPQPSEIGL